MIPAASLGPGGRLLTLALRAARTSEEDAEARDLVARLGPEAVRSLAQTNQVDALVGSGLAEAGAPLPPEWSAAVEANGRRVDALVGAAAAVSSRLAAMGVASAAIEAGGVLLATRLPLSAYCPSDIDLLVDEAGWRLAPEAFAAEGFRPADRRGRPTKRVEFRRTLPDGREQWLEAGCQPFDRMWVPLLIRDRSQHWLARAVPAARHPGLRVLDPADALALVSLHTSTHSFVRAPGLRLHVDVDRLVRDTEPCWDLYAAEVEAAGIQRRAYLSLRFASDLLGTPVPPEVLSRLEPPPAALAALENLLRSEGILAGGRPKLPPLRAARLDRLLCEAGTRAWLRSAVFPPARWMREHFDRGGAGHSIPMLHVRRFAGLMTRWRPR